MNRKSSFGTERRMVGPTTRNQNRPPRRRRRRTKNLRPEDRNGKKRRNLRGREYHYGWSEIHGTHTTTGSVKREVGPGEGT